MITTLEAVKARLGIKTEDVLDDVLLTNLIALVTGRFETFCNRTFGYVKDAVQEFDGDETEIRPAHYPVDEGQDIAFEFRDNQTDGWVDADFVNYIVRKQTVLSLSSKIATWESQCRVTYSGGYKLPDGTSPDEATVDLPDAIQLNAVEQVAYWYQNRNRLGIVSLGGEGGSIQQFSSLDLLPTVKNTLTQFQRLLC